jgi:hypothetical protein
MIRCAGLVALLLAAAPAQAETFLVQPFLQSMTPTSVWIVWETDEGEESLVEHGGTPALGERTTGSTATPTGQASIHQVQLTGLAPASAYHYRVTTGSAQSRIFHFHTPALPAAEATTRLMAVSDVQRDGNNPDKFREVTEEGMVAYAKAHFDPEITRALDMVLMVGDLVSSGYNLDHWRDQYFGQAVDLMASVPFYPVPGNHEANSPYFFNYHVLPENGSVAHLEHWWWFDQSNVRIIGLDSNNGYRLDEQVEWLEGVLDATCDNGQIDFVFAQLHHPHLSELWPDGNTGFTGRVADALSLFSSACGKPSVHFYGHTHGYSRGQKRDHNHTMVNVASAGGAIDDWGEYANQTDYPEYSVSTDDWGFVVVEVEAGDDPSFEITRVSRGNDRVALDNVVTDRTRIRRDNQQPETPRARPLPGTANAACFHLAASPFNDDDGDGHQASHWQIATACDDWSAPVAEEWRQMQNRYQGYDTQAGDDLTDQRFTDLDPGADYCWRVRYRDAGLVWSNWSTGTSFITSGDAHSEDLLINGGAEDGLTGWTTDEGFLESVGDGECDGIAPYAGEKYFAIGGVCELADYSQAHQVIDLSNQAAVIDAGEQSLRLIAYLSDFNGGDVVELDLIVKDAAGDELTRAERMHQKSNPWRKHVRVLDLPPGSRSATVVLMGTKHAGHDNDAYADALQLHLGTFTSEGCDPPPGGAAPPAPPLEPEPEPEPASCGCTGDRPQNGFLLWIFSLFGLRALLRRKPIDQDESE